jgi:nicotinate-nucleotide adenylyltransferase
VKIGVLGGSFDPIHLGHLRSAEEVREALELELVYFVPAANPPHKPERRLADGQARLAMVELATAGNPCFRASSLEIDRGGVSYSVDTLAALSAISPAAELSFIVGMDAFREMQTWRDVPRIFELASVVVTSRPPVAVEPSITHLPVAARESFCYDPSTLSYRHRSGNSIRFLPITGIDVSATAVREHVRQHRSIRYLVPAEVERFIAENRLYLQDSGEIIG